MTRAGFLPAGAAALAFLALAAPASAAVTQPRVTCQACEGELIRSAVGRFVCIVASAARAALVSMTASTLLLSRRLRPVTP